MRRLVAISVCMGAAVTVAAQSPAGPESGAATADDPAVQPAPPPTSTQASESEGQPPTAEPEAEETAVGPAEESQAAQDQPAAQGPGDEEEATGETAPQTGEAPPEAVAEEPESQATPPTDAEVARARFTSAIVEREPVDEVLVMPNDVEQIYYFTELRNLEGRTVSHIWRLDGKRMAEVSFDVGGPRWRVWSKKNLAPGWTGKWTVSVVDESGEVLSRDSFTLSDDVLRVPQ